MRFFNTAGPIVAANNYHIPPLDRIDRDEVLMLIEQQRYFVLHAPRQTGKTSALLALQDELNASGRYRCLYTNVEIGQSAREDVGEATRAILGQLSLKAEFVLGAYDYIVNGKSAVEWIMDRYQHKVDKDSQITNNPNDWSDDWNYIVCLWKKVVTVSIGSARIIKGLPSLEEGK